ncbi:MAG: TIGR04086 family membrane protein [Clostridiales bacterium]|nr:TIGR04086 family membrane protein [Clostridiales bacterium]MCD7826916.1 TIGR04086 family membrane protein [Clostridiales bacterium]
MAKNKTKNKAAKKDVSIIKNFLCPAILGIFIFIIFLIIFSFVIIKTNIEENMFWLFALAASVLSSFFTAAVSSRTASGKRLVNGMLSVIILIVGEFTVLLCFNNAALDEKIYLMFPGMLLFGFFGCVTGINLRRNK